LATKFFSTIDYVMMKVLMRKSHIFAQTLFARN
jgi:hypothetical protein